MSKILNNKLDTLLNTGELLSIVDESFSVTEVLAKLGYSKKGQYLAIVKAFLIANEVDTSHFTPNGHARSVILHKVCPVCGTNFKCIARSTNEQVTCSKGCSNTWFRAGKNHYNHKEQGTESTTQYRVKALNHYGRVCSSCGYDKHVLALDVHHIDEDRSNNKIENLRVLCCNCHAIHHRS